MDFYFRMGTCMSGVSLKRKEKNLHSPVGSYLSVNFSWILYLPYTFLLVSFIIRVLFFSIPSLVLSSLRE